MTVVIHIGRRVPRSWYRRTASKVKGLMTFQENIWQIIKQSLTKAKRKAKEDGRLSFVMTNEDELEDMHYMLQWIKIVIQGSPEMEEEEYNDSMKMYDSLGKVFKQDFQVDEKMAKHFNSKKILSIGKVQEAYKQGYGSMETNNIANKLLEMGILTHIEWNKDFESRDDVY